VSQILGRETGKWGKKESLSQTTRATDKSEINYFVQIEEHGIGESQPNVIHITKKPQAISEHSTKSNKGETVKQQKETRRKMRRSLGVLRTVYFATKKTRAE